MFVFLLVLLIVSPSQFVFSTYETIGPLVSFVNKYDTNPEGNASPKYTGVLCSSISNGEHFKNYRYADYNLLVRPETHEDPPEELGYTLSPIRQCSAGGFVLMENGKVVQIQPPTTPPLPDKKYNTIAYCQGFDKYLLTFEKTLYLALNLSSPLSIYSLPESSVGLACTNKIPSENKILTDSAVILIAFPNSVQYLKISASGSIQDKFTFKNPSNLSLISGVDFTAQPNSYPHSVGIIFRKDSSSVYSLNLTSLPKDGSYLPHDLLIREFWHPRLTGLVVADADSALASDIYFIDESKYLYQWSAFNSVSFWAVVAAFSLLFIVILVYGVNYFRKGGTLTLWKTETSISDSDSHSLPEYTS